MPAYVFRPVTPADFPLLRSWRSRPHWVEWWGPAEGDVRTSAWIVELSGRAFAYAQDYDPHAWAHHPFAHLPPGARGIDQSIGHLHSPDPFWVLTGNGRSRRWFRRQMDGARSRCLSDAAHLAFQDPPLLRDGCVLRP